MFRRAGAQRSTPVNKSSSRFSSSDCAVFSFPWGTSLDVKSSLSAAAEAFNSLSVDPPPFKVPQPLSFRASTALRGSLIKASAVLHPPQLRGCFCCNLPSCILDLRIKQTKAVFSFSRRRSFKVRGNICCTDSHVIYVINCVKCSLQGVGECKSPESRLLNYYLPIRDRAPPDSSSCSILTHFLETEHSINDFEVIFVEKLPPVFNTNPAICHTNRARLEWRWIRRLNATLNVRRNLWGFFSGWSAAREHFLD